MQGMPAEIDLVVSQSDLTLCQWMLVPDRNLRDKIKAEFTRRYQDAKSGDRKSGLGKILDHYGIPRGYEASSYWRVPAAYVDELTDQLEEFDASRLTPGEKDALQRTAAS